MSAENSTVEQSTTKSEGKGLSLTTFFGVKAGMTRVFSENGNHEPVTVIKLIPNLVSQVKTKAKEGYDSYQIAFKEKREKLINEPQKGILKKAGITLNLDLASEIRVDEANPAALGQSLTLDNFAKGTAIDVTGTSKGKGFQGVMKRYNFRGGPAAHGSHFHRRPGSIGNRATPARVFRGKKMPGRMGCDTTTVQNLTVFDVNLEKGYLLVRGSIPGGKNSVVRISHATKKV